ncbi:MAG: DUF983 domain-containing protein [Rhodobacteraceae bacterium]|nr:DUF983 domain-containing protein [Paracoccaceae bacterium]
MIEDQTPPPFVEPKERPAKPAVLRGWRRRCPQCGTGPMMEGYLKVRESCDVCGEELHHHRADDGPAYVTVLVCGHILAPVMLLVFESFRPEALVLAVGFSIVFVTMALFLLPRIKGAFVGLQWAKRMHGFGASKVVTGKKSVVE